MSPLFLFTALARADDAVKLEIRASGQVGTEPPALIIIPLKSAQRLDVTLDCGAASARHTGGAVAGEPIELLLEVRPGTFQCVGKMSGEFSDGTTGDMPLDFEIAMLAPLKITVPKEGVNLDQQVLSLSANRAISKIDVDVYGLGGVRLGDASLAWTSQQVFPVDIKWNQDKGEVIRIAVTVTDTNGFWGEVELRPWHYAIPHADVNFQTDEAVILEGEVNKLVDAMKEIQAVFEKYGRDVPVMNLYVAGYTDTVGNTEHNVHLSQMRAAALAKWFRANGFSGEVHYQGFGERGLFVSTPDNTDELRNRRAAYILGVEPPAGEQFPGQAWLQVK